MSLQTKIDESIRSTLVDWLIQIHYNFKLWPETLFLTVNVIDRFFSQHLIQKRDVQLVGIAALLMVTKYEEIYPPEIRDLVYITDHAYNKAEILEMESEIVNTLHFQLTIPTIHSFLCRYLKVYSILVCHTYCRSSICLV